MVTVMRITDAKHTSRSKKSPPNQTWFRMVPFADARWAAQRHKQKRQTLKHPQMEPFGTDRKKLLVVALASPTVIGTQARWQSTKIFAFALRQVEKKTTFMQCASTLVTSKQQLHTGTHVGIQAPTQSLCWPPCPTAQNTVRSGY